MAAENDEQVPRAELIGIAVEWGIPIPTQKSDQVLRREIYEAHCVQYMINLGVKIVPRTFKVNSRRLFRVKWMDGIKLRQAGVNFKTLALLARKKKLNMEIFSTYTKDQLIDDVGIPPIYASLIVNKFVKPDHSLPKALKEMNIQQEPKQTLKYQNALYRLQRKKWPNRDKQTFTNFLKTIEFDLQVVDLPQNQWIEFVSGLLEGNARERSEQIRTDHIHGFITYEDWKSMMLSSASSQSEKTVALHVVIQKKYDLKHHPKSHFDILESSYKMINTRATNEALAITFLSSLPERMQNVLLTKTTCKLDPEEIRSLAFWYWRQNKGRIDLK